MYLRKMSCQLRLLDKVQIYPPWVEIKPADQQSDLSGLNGLGTYLESDPSIFRKLEVDLALTVYFLEGTG